MGNSNAEVKYNVLDVKPLNGRNFYRMQQVDINGAKVYSNIVLINMNIISNSVDIFPNPAKGVANINLNNLPINNNSIGVFDVTGKSVINQQSVTGNTVKINISNLQSGTYFVKVVLENGTVLQQKLVVIN